MRSKITRNFVFGLAAFFAVAMALTTAPSALYRHYSGKKFIVRPDGGIQSPEAVALEKERQTAATVEDSGPKPKAVTTNIVHDFGTMDPLTMGKYTFEIRNGGDAPLVLEQGPTTCKCTLSNVSQNTIKPGEAGKVVLEWNTGRHAVYAHSAQVLTNDPGRPRIHFRVEGVVRKDLAIEPQSIVVARLESHASRDVKVKVYSQMSEKLELVKAISSMDGVKCTGKPLDATSLSRLEAKSGLELAVTIPAGLDEGRHNETLIVKLRNDQQKVISRKLDITAFVLRRMSIYGKGIDSTGLIDLNFIPAHEGKKIRLRIKISDRDKKITKWKISHYPTFCQVKVVPHSNPKLAKKGLYILTIDVPEGSPVSDFRVKQKGFLRIEPDHPRIKPLTLVLSFAVTKSL